MRTTFWIINSIGALFLSASIDVLGSCSMDPSYTFMATGHGSAISVECGWWLFADGPGGSLDPTNPEQGASHHKVLATGTYQGTGWWRHRISAADAQAGGSFIYVKVTSSQTGGFETRITDDEGHRIDTMEYYMSGPESVATIGPTGPGSADRPNPTKVICAELHRQGLMDEAIWKADEAFGEYLKNNRKDVLLGYQLWAKPVVKWMQKSKAFTAIVAKIATPWSYEMAYRMGARERGSLAGKILMDAGVPVCQVIGRAAMWAGRPRPESEGNSGLSAPLIPAVQGVR